LKRTITIDFEHAYTLLKKGVQDVLTKEVNLKGGFLYVILFGCAGIILLEISAGVLVAIGAGLLALSVILHTTIMAAEFQKGKEKTMKREPKKKQGEQKTIDESVGDQP
jgi:hypothetical protein